MASLGKQDFFDGSDPKTAGAGKYAGQSREQIVLSKIKAKDVFIIGKDASGKKIFGSSLDTSDWPYKLSYGEGNTIPVTKLFKDPDFGGGAGSGGGADDTKYTESGQCYFTSLVFNVIKKELKQSDCTFENLQKAAQYVDATISLDDFWIKGPVNWNEEDTYRRSANLIYKDYKSKFKTPVYCHRGSKFMDDIYKAKGKVMKTDMFSAPGSFSNDKWNPGDIWLSNLPPSEQPLKSYLTLPELKQAVLEAAGEDGRTIQTKILGVSLKKPGSSKKAVVEKYNTKDRSNYKDGSVSYDGFTYGKKGDFFSSNDIYLYMGGKDVQFRAFNSSSSWQGNIIGSGALGGKIGGGNIDYYLKKAKIKSISRSSTTWKETTASQIGDAQVKLMYELYKTYLSKQKSNIGKGYQMITTFESFKTAVKEKGNNFIFQKYMGMLLINAMESASKLKQNIVATEILRYAASNTNISSFFVKVS
jgi:hypothetical protein